MVGPMALLALVAQRSEDYGWLIFELLHVTFDFFKKIFNIQQIMEYDNLYTVYGWLTPSPMSEFCSWKPRNSPKVHLNPPQWRLMAAGKAQ